ncbi:DUF2069 domain-containing protein [Variovorax sp. PBL-H6]|uniref:DUF2069 domain-containing protein n=1 Tax=Variovorax sp. PBL-H6 TaxID=434009 RepID=UPI0013A5762B|nr:DUF2069 domain-containing protein [Variovorax sp. PBL-H6]
MPSGPAPAWRRPPPLPVLPRFLPAVTAPAIPSSVSATRWLAVGSLVGLIVLGLAWELWLAPLRPGGSWLALKVLPLVVPLAGLLKNRMYTYRWVSLLVWLYFTEGVVRAWSDIDGTGRVLAVGEVVLCLALFTACAWHVRLRLRLARARALEGVAS